MTQPTQRVTPAAVDRVAQLLTPRDEQIVRELGRVRVATSLQLQRLLFAELSGQHRDRTRRRVLARLVSLGVLATLDRRIGGVRAGSVGLVFTLDVLGRRLLQQLTFISGEQPRPRHPGTPTDRFLRHSLSVTELYVRLTPAGAALKRRACAVPLTLLQHSPMALADVLSLRDQLRRFRDQLVQAQAAAEHAVA